MAVTGYTPQRSLGRFSRTVEKVVTILPQPLNLEVKMYSFKYTPITTYCDQDLPQEVIEKVLCCKSFYYTRFDEVRRRTVPYPIKKVIDWNFYNAQSKNFPSGFLSKVIDMLNFMGEQYQLSVVAVTPDRLKSNMRDAFFAYLTRENKKLRYFQEEAVDAVLQYDTGMIEIGTGGGKTLFYGNLISTLDVKTLIITIDLTSKQQTYEELCAMLGDENVGQIDWEDYDKYPVVVANIQNCWVKLKTSKFIQYGRSVGLLVVNECHHINEGKLKTSTANTWFQVATSVPAWYRVGATGTVGNEDALQGFLFRAAIGEVIYRKPTAALIKEGFATKIEAHVYPYECGNLEYMNATTAYKNLVTEPAFNIMIADLALKYANEGKKVAVFCEWHKNQLNVLEKLLGDRAISVSGKTKKGQERTDRFRAFADGERSILIGTVFNEDVNIPAMDVGIIMGKMKNERKVKQRTGRIARLFEGKSMGIIIIPYIKDKKLVKEFDKRGNEIIVEKDGMLLRHSKEAIKILEKEGHEIIFKNYAKPKLNLTL